MIKKILLLSVLAGMVGNHALAQAPQDVDPEIAAAILDASKATPPEDPLKGVTATPAPSPAADDSMARAKEAALKLKSQGNVVQQQQAPVQAVKPKPLPPKGPEIITPEEAEMLRRYEQKGQISLEEKGADAAPIEKKKKKAIYEPSYPEETRASDNFKVERDSSKVLSKRISIYDTLDVKTCFSSAITIALDAGVQDEFQSIDIDDKIYFGVLPFENKRGALVRLVKPVEVGGHWESTLRLTRKSDDKTYLINLIGLPCPENGLNPFLKSIILEDHIGLIQSNNKVLVPEDLIIQLSKGMPRIQKNRIRVYDMVASSGSQWVVLGLEVQYPNPSEDSSMPKIVALDNLQVQTVPSKLEFLPLHSAKTTDIRGVQTLRFKLSVNVNKNYILKKRYVYLMFLDQKAGHYQYLKVDMLPYFISLLKRGYEL